MIHTILPMLWLRFKKGQAFRMVLLRSFAKDQQAQEFEPGVIQDLREALDKIAPSDVPYHHDKAWGDGNGFSHVRAALMKPSLTIPVVEGKMQLGTWQQIVFIDFDNRPRKRKVVVQVIGLDNKK